MPTDWKNPRWKVTDDEIRAREGEIVSLIVHHQGHTDRAVPMMCGGAVGEKRYLFVQGVVEKLDGRREVRGIVSWGEGCTSYEGDNRFEVCNLPHEPPVHDHSSECLGDNFDKVLALWDYRKVSGK